MFCLISKWGVCVCVMHEFQTNLNAKPKMMNRELKYLTCALRNNINLPPLSRPETNPQCLEIP